MGGGGASFCQGICPCGARGRPCLTTFARGSHTAATSSSLTETTPGFKEARSSTVPSSSVTSSRRSFVMKYLQSARGGAKYLQSTPRPFPFLSFPFRARAEQTPPPYICKTTRGLSCADAAGPGVRRAEGGQLLAPGHVRLHADEVACRAALFTAAASIGLRALRCEQGALDADSPPQPWRFGRRPVASGLA